MLENFNEGMMRFVFGEIVTIMKANILPMFCMAGGVAKCTGVIPILGDGIKVPLGDWNRKVQMTTDRGGLLACQDFEAAMHYLMVLAGVPLKMVKEINIYDYVEMLTEQGNGAQGFAEKLGNLNKTVFNIRTAWSNERIVELFRWYESGGYDAIMARHT